VIVVRFISGRLIFGLAILVVGVLLLLKNLGLNIDLNIRQILNYWPAIPLLLGLNWLFLSFGSTKAEEGKKVFFSWGQFTTALIAIAVGVVFLGRNLGLFQIDTRLFLNLLWPFILILIGINLLRGRAVSGGKGGRFSFMGGSNVGGAQSWNLESGSYFALMGGLEMDLTSAVVAEGETILDLTAIMGGIDVKIPRDMAVIYDGSAVLGGVTFKDQEDGGIIGGRRIEANITPETKGVVRIQARAIMGGIEIKEV
jgi:hypothetical protein